MNTKKISTLSATALLTFSFIPTVSAHEGGYVTDGSGIVVRDESGDCVESSTGNILEDCGIQTAAPIEPPAAAPIVVPPSVAPPKPKPVIRPPSPIVKVLTLNESGGSNFGFDRDKLTTRGRDALAGFVSSVKALNVAPQAVTITGHTDSIGSDAYNQKLSLRRANSVAGFLTSQGINRAVMNISGKGESQPAASNKSKAGRAQNRRVDINVKGQRKVTVRR